MRHGFLPVEAESADADIPAMLCAFQLVVPLDLAYSFFVFFFVFLVFFNYMPDVTFTC